MSPRVGAGGPRVLLLEALDSVGCDAADARERAALFERAGATVVPLAVTDEPWRESTNGTRVIESGPEVHETIRMATCHARFDRVVVASASPGGGALAGLLPQDTPAFWWPTGLGPAAAGSKRVGWFERWSGRRRLASLWDGAGEFSDQAADPLAGVVVESRELERPCLRLWDGEVVVVPEGFEGSSGRVVLESFAGLAGDWSAVDLVAWIDAPLEGEAHARRLGIEGRVHHAGAPTRMAEWAWWKYSQAVVLTGSRPVSRGLLLRALASGCPVLCVPRDRDFAAAADVLARQGCVRVVAPERRAVASALEDLLTRGPGVEEQIARGRGFSAARTGATLREVLARWLGVPPPSRRAHAA